jgi:DNA-binding beta-propeller fold protein YncE
MKRALERVAKAVLVVASVSSVASGQQDSIRYHVERRVSLDSAGADFLAIDPARGRLYGAGDRVIDIGADSVIGTLPPHTGFGFALATDLGRGIGRRGVIFDLTTFTIITRLAVKGDGMAYEPKTHRAFLLADTITAVDLKSNTVVGTIPLDGLPESAVADNTGRLYLTVPDRGELDVINAKKLTVERHIALNGCRSPHGMAIDVRAKRIFLSCLDHVLAVMDPKTGQLVATAPTAGRANSIAFDATRKLIFNPNADSTMTVVREDSPDQYRVVQVVTTGEGERTIAVDQRTHKAYLYRHNGKGLVVLVMSPT